MLYVIAHIGDSSRTCVEAEKVNLKGGKSLVLLKTMNSAEIAIAEPFWFQLQSRTASHSPEALGRCNRATWKYVVSSDWRSIHADSDYMSDNASFRCHRIWIRLSSSFSSSFLVYDTASMIGTVTEESTWFLLILLSLRVSRRKERATMSARIIKQR